MTNLENNFELRSEISKLTANSIPSKHPQLIEGLKSKFNHSIGLISNPDFIDATEDCLLYVMKNVLNDSSYRKLKEKIVGIRNFNDLINGGFISVHDGLNGADRVVVYFDENGVTHFGLSGDRKIKSKWGRGLVWEHPLFEVPIEYGNIAKFSDGSLKVSGVPESREICPRKFSRIFKARRGI